MVAVLFHYLKTFLNISFINASRNGHYHWTDQKEHAEIEETGQNSVLIKVGGIVCHGTTRDVVVAEQYNVFTPYVHSSMYTSLVRWELEILQIFNCIPKFLEQSTMQNKDTSGERVSYLTLFL